MDTSNGLPQLFMRKNKTNKSLLVSEGIILDKQLIPVKKKIRITFKQILKYFYQFFYECCDH